jgi:phosphoribulokinase
MKPVYRHTDGTFGAPVYVNPARFVVTEGLLAFQNKELCDMFDVRVYLAPPEELRRQWKVQRDCSRRGYTTDQVLSELDRREPDSEAFIRPQRERADIVVSFQPGTRSDADHLDARLTLRHTLPQPDLADFVGNEVTLVARDDSLELNVPGTISTEEAAQIEEAIWERLHFARHLRTQRLGEFTVGTALHRSDALGLVQLLILYHVVTARAVVALGGESARPFQLPTGDELVDEIFGEESAAL